MTAKEFVYLLNLYIRQNPERADYIVKMVGHDADGERNYDIDIDDIGIDSNKKIVHLWD